VAIAAAIGYSGSDPKPAVGFHAEISLTASTITNTTEAKISGRKTASGSIASAGDITVFAEDKSAIYVGSGEVGVTTGTTNAAGAALALNTITNTTRAAVTNATLSVTSGKVTVSTDSTGDIVAVALGVEVATGTAKYSGAGSVATNVISNTIERTSRAARRSRRQVTFR
jgi:hypothetical protein